MTVHEVNTTDLTVWWESNGAYIDARSWYQTQVIEVLRTVLQALEAKGKGAIAALKGLISRLEKRP